MIHAMIRDCTREQLDYLIREQEKKMAEAAEELDLMVRSRKEMFPDAPASWSSQDFEGDGSRRPIATLQQGDP